MISSYQYKEVGHISFADNLLGGIAYQNNTIYLAVGWSGFYTIDVTDPTHPHVLGNYYGIYVRSIDVGGTTAFVAGNGVIAMVDISDPTNLVEIAQYSDGTGSGDGVYHNGTYVFLSDGSDGLEIYDYNSTHIFPVGSYTSGMDLVTTTTTNNIAYLGCLDVGIQIVNITDFSNITLISSVSSPSYILDLVQYNSILWSLGNDIYKFDISNPANVATLANTNQLHSLAINIAVSGNIAAVAEDSNGFELLNITDPTNIYQFGSNYNSIQAHDVLIHNNILYVAEYGVRAFNITDPYNPVQTAFMSSAYLSQSIELYNDSVLIFGNANGLTFLDMGSNGQLSFISSTSTTAINKITVLNSTIFAATSTGFAIFDAQNILGISTLYINSTIGNSIYLTTDGNYLYL